MDISKLMGLDKLDSILSRIEKRPLHLFANQCLKERNRRLTCDACQKGCPAGAIDLSAGVEVDFSRCVDCGICVNICPTGVFESRLTEDYFLSRIQNCLRSGRIVGFSCSKQSAAAGGNKSAVEVEVPCLGRVSEAMLVGAAAFGAETIWLNTSVCSECDAREGLTLARQTVRGVDKLLEAWGRRVRFVLTAKLPVDRASSGAVEDEGGAYNRRELLAKLKREALVAGLGLAQGRIDKVAGAFEPAANRHFDSRLPRKRELLLRLTKKLGEPAQDSLHTEDLSLYGLACDAGRCNLCGNCAVFCPTEALRIDKGGDAVRLSFNVSRCLGCDLCVEVCSPRALSIDTQIHLSHVLKEADRSLVDMTYFECAKCKQPFPAAEKKPLCDFCRVREEKLNDDSWS